MKTLAALGLEIIGCCGQSNGYTKSSACMQDHAFSPISRPQAVFGFSEDSLIRLAGAIPTKRQRFLSPNPIRAAPFRCQNPIRLSLSLFSSLPELPLMPISRLRVHLFYMNFHRQVSPACEPQQYHRYVPLSCYDSATPCYT